VAEPALNVLADRPRPGAARRFVTSAIEGLDALYLAGLLDQAASAPVLFVARDGVRADRLARLIGFFAPELGVAVLPAWDCLPYDRVSPNGDVMAKRLDTLARLLDEHDRPRLVITTVNALVQKVPPPEVLRSGLFVARAGQRIDRAHLLGCLARNGYRRSGTAVEPGEYAVRGGIIDIFPSGSERPLRLDLFGDELEGIRAFDPLTQRSQGAIPELRLRAVSEVLLDAEAIERFRSGYLKRFGATTGDPLFESVSAGRPYPGMEHWLPLFHDHLVPITEYLAPGGRVGFDHLAEEALESRHETIGEHYDARRHPPEAARAMGAAPYRPLLPDELYLSEQALAGLLDGRDRFDLMPFAAPSGPGGGETVDLGGKRARDFAAERARPDLNLFEATALHLKSELALGKRVAIAGASEGSLERLRMVLADHGVEGLHPAACWAEVEAGAGIGLAVLPLEHGFVTTGACVLAETDIVGDRLSRPVRKARRSDKFIAEVAGLGEGDLVVHRDHGIGSFDGLVTLSLAGAPHDCLRLIYQGGDKLLVPVENLDVLSRYGAADGSTQLDKLGGLGWQTRKARVKKRIREIAGELIQIAARRAMRKGELITPPSGLYEEFAARFAYDETEDQDRAIDAVLDDLERGTPHLRSVIAMEG
jgi:transcription-repair coupling factor (superfamily II helicase)